MAARIAKLSDIVNNIASQPMDVWYYVVKAKVAHCDPPNGTPVGYTYNACPARRGCCRKKVNLRPLGLSVAKNGSETRSKLQLYLVIENFLVGKGSGWGELGALS